MATLGYQGELHGFTMKGSLARNAWRRPGSRWSRLHHLRFQNGRPADVRDAAGFRRRAARERAFRCGCIHQKTSPNPLLYILGFVLGGNRRSGWFLYFKPSS